LLLKSFVTTGLFAVLQDHDQYTRRDWFYTLL
jgi:hypothetical protein